jgi:hypothetical protein
MANFSTHLLGAVGAGVVATAVLAAADLLPLTSVPAGIGLVALGGIAPDVDSDNSDAIGLVFGTLGVGLAAPLMVAAVPALGLLVSLVLVGAAFALVRYALVVPFRLATVHRGRWHSLPTGILLAAALAMFAHRGLHLDPLEAWLLAALFALGFLAHLVLDELYSVDLANRYIKRSFGSALKLFERDDPLGYLGLYAATAVLLVVAPSPRAFVEAVASVEVGLLPPPAVLALLP